MPNPFGDEFITLSDKEMKISDRETDLLFDKLLRAAWFEVDVVGIPSIHLLANAIRCSEFTNEFALRFLDCETAKIAENLRTLQPRDLLVTQRNEYGFTIRTFSFSGLKLKKILPTEFSYHGGVVEMFAVFEYEETEMVSFTAEEFRG